MVLLQGSHGNRDAIGARLVLRVGDRKHLRLVSAGSGFLSSNDPREHFGLGAATTADELQVPTVGSSGSMRWLPIVHGPRSGDPGRVWRRTHPAVDANSRFAKRSTRNGASGISGSSPTTHCATNRAVIGAATMPVRKAPVALT